MTDEAIAKDVTKLLASIHDDILAWDWDADEGGPHLATDYAERVSQLGRTRVLRSVYRTYTGSMRTSLILKLGFVWKDMHYREWLRVLAEAPEIRETEMPYFRTLFCGYLAVSIDEAVRQAALSQDTKARLLPEGRPVSDGPLWGHVEDVFANNGLDPWGIWRRLAAEGAPMLISSERLSRGETRVSSPE